jgi:hypothetical protein
MPSEVPEGVRCASYTHARRHPMVLGRIAGWTPPFQLTVTQIAVLLGSFFGLVWTWELWAGLLPSGAATAVALGVPTGATWAVRRVRVEGRSLPRALLGWLQLAVTPTAGTVAGRPARAGGRRTAGGRIYLAAGEP